ncbi:MAG: HAD family hydrolase [Leptospirales bacterium]|nr:HAD family hydrolase [Leptospirales bacterium]
MKPVHAILFDYDDTLVRTREIRYGTIKKMARDAFRFSISDSEIDAAWGTPGDVFLLKLFGQYAGGDMQRLWTTYNDYCSSDPNQFHAGAEDFLREFGGRFKFGIVTSSSRKRVDPELSALGLSFEQFVAIQTAEDSSAHKPDPLVFEPICARFKQLGILPENILYVGDARYDFVASTGFGLQFIGMAHGPRELAGFQQHSIAYVQSFQELEALMNRGQSDASQME